MSSFLSLVKDAERESGTMPSLLSTVTSTTGRHTNFVNWVAQAWTEIQMEREDWAWMRADFEGALTASVDLYDPAALGIERFGSWVHDTDHGLDFTLYTAADGQAGEGYLRFIPWPDFRRVYTVGQSATQTGTPTVITVAPGGSLRVWPVPDAPCTLRGEYMKSPQTLAVDGDIPEMPTQFHHAIRLKALLKMATFDEAMAQFPVWQRDYAVAFTALVRSQTPRISMGAPLA
jgi:hypothetical protein